MVGVVVVVERGGGELFYLVLVHVYQLDLEREREVQTMNCGGKSQDTFSSIIAMPKPYIIMYQYLM